MKGVLYLNSGYAVIFLMKIEHGRTYIFLQSSFHRQITVCLQLYGRIKISLIKIIKILHLISQNKSELTPFSPLKKLLITVLSEFWKLCQKFIMH